jgi:uncharacterized protein (TIGR02466 family)
MKKIPDPIRKRIHDVFPTRIYTVDVADYELLNKNLIKIIDEERDLYGSRNISNKSGGHQTKDGKFLDAPDCEYKSRVLLEMTRAIESFSSDMNVDLENFAVRCQESWANINVRGSGNMSHVHPMTHWACVYYVYVPENAGMFLINDPRGGIPQMYSMPYINDESPYKNDKLEPDTPEGRLLIFPGWMSHEVSPNMSDEKRYTIAANFSYYMKKDLTNQAN